MYGLSLYAAPAAEPVSLTEAKAHLRVTYTDDDTLIADLIAAARQWFEEQTYRALVTQTWDLKLDEFPESENAIRIPRAPLQSVTSIVYVNSTGGSTTWSSAQYAVSATRQPGLIRPAYGYTYPADVRDQPDAVTVRFVAGYGGAAAVPAAVKAALKLLIGQLYEHREPVVTGTIATAIPLSVQHLIQQYDLGDELLEYGAATTS